MKRLGGAWLLLLTLSACGGASPPKSSGPPIAASNELECPSGFEQGPHGTCFALPSAPSADTPLLLLVHSAADQATLAAELRAVRAAALERAVVVYALGSQSACAWSRNVRATHCWPASGGAAAQQEWKGWERALWQAEALLPEGKHARVVVAVGDGAEFAAAAVREGALPVDHAAWFQPEGEAGALRAPGTLVQWFGADAELLQGVPAAERHCQEAASGIGVDAVQRVLERLQAGVRSDDPSCGAAPAEPAANELTKPSASRAPSHKR